MEDSTNMLQEFKSEHVVFTFKRKPECIIEYTVQASSDIVKKAREAAIRAISKEVSVPGFRKGRVPTQLLIKHFSKSLKEKWEKNIAQLAFSECQTISPISMFSQAHRVSCNVINYSLEDGAKLTCIFETNPTVPDIDLNSIELKEVQRVPVDEKLLKDTFYDIQLLFAKWEHPYCGARAKDFVHVDLDIIEQDAPREVLVDHRFEMDRGRMNKWLFDLIIDMKVGEIKEGFSRVDEEATEEEKVNFSPQKVRLVLHNIERPHQLPDIDDVLAQRLGAKNEQDMREKVEKSLNKQADEYLAKAYCDQVHDYLLTTYPFDLPESLVLEETSSRFRQCMDNPAFKSSIEEAEEEEVQQIMQEIQRDGENALRLFYISRKIIEDNDIIIDMPEADQEEKPSLLEFLLYPEKDQLLNPKARSEQDNAMLASRLFLKKATDFVVSRAKILPLQSEIKGIIENKNGEKEEENEEK